MKLFTKSLLPENHPFLNNKYTQWYYDIIDNARKREKIEGYTEKHHIIPESFFINRKRNGPKGWLDGDPNNSNNLINLTGREHFVCHLLLIKMTEGEAKRKTSNAAWRICTGLKKSNLNTNSYSYELIRKIHCENNTNRIFSKETRKKMSDAKKGKPGLTKGRKHTSATKQKIREKRALQDMSYKIGSKQTEETKQKIRERRKLQRMMPRTEETKQKISKSNMGKPCSSEKRMKIKETLSKPARAFVCIETGKKYYVRRQAAKDLGIRANGISKALSSDSHYTSGYHFVYIE